MRPPVPRRVVCLGARRTHLGPEEECARRGPKSRGRCGAAGSWGRSHPLSAPPRPPPPARKAPSSRPISLFRCVLLLSGLQAASLGEHDGGRMRGGSPGRVSGRSFLSFQAPPPARRPPRIPRRGIGPPMGPRSQLEAACSPEDHATAEGDRPAARGLPRGWGGAGGGAEGVRATPRPRRSAPPPRFRSPPGALFCWPKMSCGGGRPARQGEERREAGVTSFIQGYGFCPIVPQPVHQLQVSCRTTPRTTPHPHLHVEAPLPAPPPHRLDGAVLGRLACAPWSEVHGPHSRSRSCISNGLIALDATPPWRQAP